MRHKACAFPGGEHRCGGRMAMTSLTPLLARADSADLAGSVHVPSLPHTVCVPLPKLQAQNRVETWFA